MSSIHNIEKKCKKIFDTIVENIWFLSILAVAVIGILISLFMFYTLRQIEKKHLDQQLEWHSTNYADHIQEVIHHNVEVLASIGSLFSSSTKVERENFQKFTKAFLERHIEIQALEWIPRVLAAERETYEQEARNSGMINFVITEQDSSGRLVIAPQREEYFPVYYVEPLKGNEIALGFDLASNRTRREALRQAMDSGEMVTSGRINLIQDHSNQYGLLIFQPIYRMDTKLENVEQRRAALLGFALGVYRVDYLLQKAFTSNRISDLVYEITNLINLTLYDESAPSSERLMYVSSDDGHMTQMAPQVESNSQRRYELRVPGRRWSLLIAPTPAFLLAHDEYGAWWALTGGLIVTSVLIFHLWSGYRRRQVLTNFHQDSLGVMEKLRYNQVRLAEAQRRAQLGNWAWDIPNDNFYWSDELFNLFGVKPNNFSCDYQTFLDYIHPDDREKFNNKIQRALQGEQCKMDLRIVRSDAQERVFLTFFEILDMQDETLRVVGTSQDVTDLRKNEDQLRKLSRVVEQSPEAICITDLKGCIEYVNDAFVEASGYPRSELIGQALKILHSGLTPQETYDSLWAALRQGCPWHGEFINRRKNGEIYYENTTISPIRQSDGRITHYGAVKENNTEKRQMFAELERYRHHLEDLVQQRTDQLAEARERAETANRAKSAFLANMSHEIRTPLTAIIGFAESMLDNGQRLAERIDAIHTIIRNGRHLQNLISDILDFSKIEADRLEIELTQISFLDLLKDIHAMGQVQASEKGLEFDIHYLPPLPSVIISDPTRLKQILINLIGNAIKFTSPPGAVRWLVSLDKENKQVMFSIQDTGIGISEEEIQNLFKPFVQGDISITRRFGGTGLGLTISQALARLLGGDIRLISDKGCGSLFVVTLPVGSLEGVALIEGNDKFVMGSGLVMMGSQAPPLAGRVLVAEDNPDNQKLISLLIRRTNAEFVIVKNGQEAVERAQIEDFDLVLMDIQMPVMGGIDATELLRIMGFNHPIVALTANATESDKAKAREVGCDGFLTKPIDQEAFFAVLKRYLPKGDMPTAHTTVAPANSMGLEGDPEFQEMCNDFARELPAKLRNIEDAYQRKDWSVVRALAHQLKGVAANFGMPEVTRISGDIEFQVLRGDYDTMRYLISELTALCPHRI